MQTSVISNIIIKYILHFYSTHENKNILVCDSLKNVQLTKLEDYVSYNSVPAQFKYRKYSNYGHSASIREMITELHIDEHTDGFKELINEHELARKHITYHVLYIAVNYDLFIILVNITRNSAHIFTISDVTAIIDHIIMFMDNYDTIAYVIYKQIQTDNCLLEQLKNTYEGKENSKLHNKNYVHFVKSIRQYYFYCFMDDGRKIAIVSTQKNYNTSIPCNIMPKDMLLFNEYYITLCFKYMAIVKRYITQSFCKNYKYELILEVILEYDGSRCVNQMIKTLAKHDLIHTSQVNTIILHIINAKCDFNIDFFGDKEICLHFYNCTIRDIIFPKCLESVRFLGCRFLCGISCLFEIINSRYIANNNNIIYTSGNYLSRNKNFEISGITRTRNKSNLCSCNKAISFFKKTILRRNMCKYHKQKVHDGNIDEIYMTYTEFNYYLKQFRYFRISKLILHDVNDNSLLKLNGCMDLILLIRCTMLIKISDITENSALKIQLNHGSLKLYKTMSNMRHTFHVFILENAEILSNAVFMEIIHMMVLSNVKSLECANVQFLDVNLKPFLYSDSTITHLENSKYSDSSFISVERCLPYTKKELKLTAKNMTINHKLEFNPTVTDIELYNVTMTNVCIFEKTCRNIKINKCTGQLIIPGILVDDINEIMINDNVILKLSRSENGLCDLELFNLRNCTSLALDVNINTLWLKECGSEDTMLVLNGACCNLKLENTNIHLRLASNIEIEHLLLIESRVIPNHSISSMCNIGTSVMQNSTAVQAI